MIKPHFWITRKAIRTKHKRMVPQFLDWEAQGLLSVFEKDVHDYDKIREYIYSDISEYHVRYIGYDQYQAPAVVNWLEQRASVTAVKIPQTTTRMNAGAKELVRAIGARQFTANRNPILRWNADNTIYKMDNELNIKPDKKSSLDNIDGVTSLVNALTVRVTVPESMPMKMFVFEHCPVCRDDDIVVDEASNMGRCRECGHLWRTT
jgi:phage terminase large subunit-like protein